MGSDSLFTALEAGLLNLWTHPRGPQVTQGSRCHNDALAQDKTVGPVEANMDSCPSKA